MAQIKVAAVQVGSKLFDTPATIELFASKLRAAKELGADLVVFPEAFVGGYPKGIDFDVRVGMRTDLGRSQFREYFDSAISRSSEELTLIRNLVKETSVHAVIGIIEKSAGTLFCCTATISPEGEVVTWHRKLMPTAMERVIWGQGDGSTMKVAETPLGKISTAICWENYMPLYRYHLYQQGSQIHCVPTVDDRDVWLPTMQTVALEGRCFVISACQFMTLEDVKADWFEPVHGTKPETVLIRGGSCIVSPLGDVLAAPVFGKEAIVTAEIDLNEITRGKFDLDITGHYSRPDVFALSVDTSLKQ